MQAALREPPVNEALAAASAQAAVGRPDAVSVAERMVRGLRRRRRRARQRSHAQARNAISGREVDAAGSTEACAAARERLRCKRPPSMNARSRASRNATTPLPGSTEALQRERVRAAALRGENTPAQWVAAADAEARDGNDTGTGNAATRS